LEKITSSSTCEEFVIHVSEGFDYSYKSAQKNEIITVTSDTFYKLSGKKLKISTHENPDAIAVKTPTFGASVFGKSSIGDKGDSAAGVHRTHAEAKEDDDDDEGVVNMLEVKEKISVKDFDLLKMIGKGAFGQVLQVRHKATGKIYAMKIVKKRFVIEQQKVASTIAEKNILSAFQNPFIMALKFAFQSRSKLYLVMEYYTGGELLGHLEQKQRFSEDEARIMVAELMIALGHLHSLNFIYRDLKPENVLMGQDGHVCLTDFGLVKQVDPSRPESLTFCGTPHYMAPELVLQNPHTKAVDWWSLGIILYELVVGIPPFLGENINEIFEQIIGSEANYPTWMSDDCIDLISKLLVKNPVLRLGSGDGDFEEIIIHPFFSSIDWEKLVAKDLTPPYVPEVIQPPEPTAKPDAGLHVIAESVATESLAGTFAHVNFADFTYVRASIAERMRKLS